MLQVWFPPGVLPESSALSVTKERRLFIVKILSRALSNRLKEVLANIIHKDQSYCVSDRTIMYNIFVIRDIIDICNCYNIDIGIVALGQEKAFDRVNHGFLHLRLLVLVAGLCPGLGYFIIMHSVW